MKGSVTNWKGGGKRTDLTHKTFIAIIFITYNIIFESIMSVYFWLAAISKPGQYNLFSELLFKNLDLILSDSSFE